MIASATSARAWLPGAGLATLAHAALVAGALWLGMGERIVPIEEPIVLIELPPLAGAAPAASAALQPAPADPKPQATPPIAAPAVAVQLPREFVAVPPPASVPAATVQPRVAVAPPAAAVQPAPVQSAAPGTSASEGTNPRAKQQEADYFAQLSAHLNKRKRYPAEAKKARQQGVVTVRFTVHSDGSVSGGAIRKSSGHALLDSATLELLQRVAPLPRFPKSMTRDSVSLSLPIDYSLQTT